MMAALPVKSDPGFDADALLAAVGSARDKGAFVTLFNHYAPRVKSWLLKAGEAPSAADEIVQNTFVSVWEKAAGFNPAKAAASTWIFSIARNKRIDALRRARFLSADADEVERALDSAVAEPPDAYASADDAERLGEAMKSLPEEQARLVRMAFFEDKSHSAIAAETRLPLGTVKSRLRLALSRLRGLLKGGAHDGA